jgi:hypothetical protein
MSGESAFGGDAWGETLPSAVSSESTSASAAYARPKRASGSSGDASPSASSSSLIPPSLHFGSASSAASAAHHAEPSAAASHGAPYGGRFGASGGAPGGDGGEYVGGARGDGDGDETGEDDDGGTPPPMPPPHPRWISASGAANSPRAGDYPVHHGAGQDSPGAVDVDENGLPLSPKKITWSDEQGYALYQVRERGGGGEGGGGPSPPHTHTLSTKYVMMDAQPLSPHVYSSLSLSFRCTSRTAFTTPTPRTLTTEERTGAAPSSERTHATAAYQPPGPLLRT